MSLLSFLANLERESERERLVTPQKRMLSNMNDATYDCIQRFEIKEPLTAEYNNPLIMKHQAKLLNLSSPRKLKKYICRF